MMHRLKNTLMILMVLATGITITGCSTYRADNSVAPAAAIPEEEDSADFLDRASQMSAMDTDNALHGFCILLDGEDTNEDFEARVAYLQEKNVVSGRWKLAPGATLTKGKLAYMTYQACEVKEKGAILAMLGPNQRYCLKELQYRRMMSPGLESEPVTGMEYIAVLTRADSYIQTGKFPNAVGDVEE